MTPPTDPAPLVEMRGIVKSFFGEAANAGVSLTLRRGEVLALLGENGAGKSTLMKVLYGLYAPKEGEILVRGRPVRIRSPAAAVALGIGMVQQHFALVEEMTAAENVLLGRRGFLLGRAEAEREVARLSARYRLPVDPGREVRSLSVGEKQRVEIVKALSRGAEILILDEPTAVLTPHETEELGTVLRALRAEGKGIVFITHRLPEVFAFSDRVMVLRSGVTALEKRTAETTAAELARAMVGRPVAASRPGVRRAFGVPVLSVRNLWARNDLGLPALRGVSLTVREGEIAGLAGVSGNGQRELMEILSGARRAEAGEIVLRERKAAGFSPRQLVELGVGRIPEDRMETGAILDLSLAENLALERYHLPPLARRGWRDRRRIREFAGRLAIEYSIKAHGLEAEAATLSGGNLQKAILARALDPRPALVLASQPTRGLDLAAAAFVHGRLRAERERGAAILLVSEDLEEILALSDTIAVIAAGRIAGVFPREEADRGRIGLLMAGGAR